MPVEVLTEVTFVDVLGATLTREAPTTVPAEVLGETLALTGSSAGLPFLLAGGLLFLGAALTLFSRRRSQA